MFIRLNEFKEAAPLPLAEVRERIESELSQRKLRALSEAEGETALEKLNAGETLEQLAAEKSLEVVDHGFVSRNQAEVDAAIRNLAFTMPRPEQGIVYEGLSVGGGDYVVVELSAVLSNDAPLEQEVLQRITQNRAGAEYQAAIKMLTGRAEIVKTPGEELSRDY